MAHAGFACKYASRVGNEFYLGRRVADFYAVPLFRFFVVPSKFVHDFIRFVDDIVCRVVAVNDQFEFIFILGADGLEDDC